MSSPTAPDPARSATSVGVCSWSLQPTSAPDLIDKLHAAGLSAVQLHLDPLRTGAWDAHQTGTLLRSAGIQIISGMVSAKGEDYSTLESIRETGGVRPDATWDDNLAAARANAGIAARLKVALVTLHAGFVPPPVHRLPDPLHAGCVPHALHGVSAPLGLQMVSRIKQLAAGFAEHAVKLALETGQ